MKINYLKLKNIGPFVGEHIIDFNTNNDFNIVLIGGKNGSGKTTILNSIKYGLFGSYALGLKTDTDKYFDEINSLLNNQKHDSYFVEISFEFVENFTKFNYILKRSWKKDSDSIIEKVEIIKDNKRLDDFDTKEICDKIKAITSPNLINSFLFDGEKIGSLIDKGQITPYLKDTFDSLFGIDVIRQTKKDLNNYLIRESKKSDFNIQIESVTILSNIDSLRDEIKTLESGLATNISKINNLKSIKKSNEEEFFRLGGLTKDEKSVFLSKIKSLNVDREKHIQNIKHFLDNDFVYFYCRKNLEKIIEQSKQEVMSNYINILREIEKEVGYRSIELENKLLEYKNSFEIVYNLDSRQINDIKNRIDESSSNANEVIAFLKSSKENSNELKLLKRTIINNDNLEKLKHLLKQNQELEILINNLDLKNKTILEVLNKCKKDLLIQYDIYNKKKEEFKKLHLEDSSFVKAKNILDICDLLANTIIENKISIVSSYALDVFKRTIRKKDYINKIIINNEFVLSLLDNDNNIMDINVLSAGETQLLISSLIWAMFKVSERREMFIFDTPLARLDKENRNSFIKNVILTMGEQVVILSTDSEFIDDNLTQINNNIHTEYLLEYDEISKKTQIIEGYFNGGK